MGEAEAKARKRVKLISETLEDCQAELVEVIYRELLLTARRQEIDACFTESPAHYIRHVVKQMTEDWIREEAPYGEIL